MASTTSAALAKAAETFQQLQEELSVLIQRAPSEDDMQERTKLHPPPSERQRLDPLCTNRAKFMSRHFEIFGVVSLANYIVEIARDEVKCTDQGDNGDARSSSPFRSPSPGPRAYNKSWDLILHDAEQNGCRKILYYLSSLPADLVEALIAGTLPSRMREPAFQRRMRGHVAPQDRQGTYGVYISVKSQSAQSTQDDTIVNQHAGHGLSLRQLLRVHEAMRLYIDVDDAASVELAKRIDKAYSGQENQVSSFDYQTQRRYGSGGASDQFGYHRDWLRFVDTHYLKWARTKLGTPEAHLLDEPLKRCFVYVGLSSSVSGRLPNHMAPNVIKSPVFGLLTATLQHIYPDKFSVAESVYQVFKTVSKDDIGFDEKLSMLLMGAYPWDGGLNAAHGGLSRGSGPRQDSPRYHQKLKQSRDEIKASGLVAENMRMSDEKIAQVHQGLDARDELPQLRALALESVREHHKKLNEARDELTRTRNIVRLARLTSVLGDIKTAKARQSQFTHSEHTSQTPSERSEEASDAIREPPESEGNTTQDPMGPL